MTDDKTKESILPKLLNRKDAVKYLCSRGLPATEQWLRRGTGAVIPFIKITQYAFYKVSDLEAYLNGDFKTTVQHIKTQRIPVEKKPALTIEQWFDILNTHSIFWSSEAHVKEAVQLWYDYKKEKKEAYVSPLRIKALAQAFKGREFTFARAVQYAIAKEYMGVFPIDWACKAELEDQKLAEQAIRNANTNDNNRQEHK